MRSWFLLREKAAEARAERRNPFYLRSWFLRCWWDWRSVWSLNVAIPSIWGLGSYEMDAKKRKEVLSRNPFYLRSWFLRWGKSGSMRGERSRNPFYLRSWFLRRKEMYTYEVEMSQSLLFEVLVPTIPKWRCNLLVYVAIPSIWGLGSYGNQKEG